MPIPCASPRVEDLASLALRTALRRGRKESTLENKRNAWEQKIVPSFAGRDAATVEHDEAQDVADSWAGTFGPHAALKAAREAGHGWGLAMQRGWILRTPWHGVYVPGAVRSPQRFMPAADRQALREFLEPIALHGAPSPFHRWGAAAILMLAECPAGRLAETAGLEWSGVDFRAGLITWRRHKTDQRGPKHAVMTDYLRAVLKAAKAARTGSRWVFPGVASGKPVHDLTKTMARMCRHIGIGKYTPHDLRRGIAQEALDAGGSIEDISAMLGHESVRTTESYLRWSSTRARRAQSLVTLGGARRPQCSPPADPPSSRGGR